MNMTTSRTAVLGMLAALALAPGLALGEDAATLKGMIISHKDTTIVVRSPAGDTPVILTHSTKIRGVAGGLGLRGEDHPPTDLIRGLAVEVTTTGAGADLTATAVTFKNSDLKTAHQIAAGLSSTDENVNKNAEGVHKNAEGIKKNAQGISENSERIDNVGLLVAAGRTKVLFPVGKAVISAKGQQDLQAIAAQAGSIKGAYRLAVVGRADTTGNVAANQRLSEARAAAVKDYLIRSCGISPANFIPAASLGSAPVAQDPDPPANNTEARRVTVTIAVSKSSLPH